MEYNLPNIYRSECFKKIRIIAEKNIDLFYSRTKKAKYIKEIIKEFKKIKMPYFYNVCYYHISCGLKTNQLREELSDACFDLLWSIDTDFSRCSKFSIRKESFEENLYYNIQSIEIPTFYDKIK